MPVEATSPLESEDSPRILVVDDDPGMRGVLADILESHGYSTKGAGSGEEALQEAKVHHCDLALVDLRLPDMPGTELLQPLLKANAHMAIILLTGFADLDSAVEALHGGAFAYLTKPMNVGDLLSKIEEALEKQKQLEEEMRLREFYWRRSITDELTQVYNRRYFDELLSQEIARSERHGRSFLLLMVDIDDFKEYNDLHGHLEGDRGLTEIATLLQQATRRNDTVARYGGEEFAIIVSEAIKEVAWAVAERLREKVETARLEREELRRCLTISVGVAAFPCDAQTKEDLIAKADEALYAAKALGKNRACLFASQALGAPPSSPEEGEEIPRRSEKVLRPPPKGGFYDACHLDRG